MTDRLAQLEAENAALRLAVDTLKDGGCVHDAGDGVLMMRRDELDALRADLAALKGQNCKTCRHQVEQSDADTGAKWLMCDVIAIPCSELNEHCGWWEQKSATTDTTSKDASQSNVRNLYMGTNETKVFHAVPSIHPGDNWVTEREAELLMGALRSALSGHPSDKLKRQTARRLWDLFHDPYDAGMPEWIR